MLPEYIETTQYEYNAVLRNTHFRHRLLNTIMQKHDTVPMLKHFNEKQQKGTIFIAGSSCSTQAVCH